MAFSAIENRRKYVTRGRHWKILIYQNGKGFFSVCCLAHEIREKNFEIVGIFYLNNFMKKITISILS